MMISPSPTFVAKPFARPNPRGFTLIELLLSLSVAAIVLATSIYYVFSIANIWSNRTQNDFFRQHVDGLTLFLNHAFARAENIPLRPLDSGELGVQSLQATPRQHAPKINAPSPDVNPAGDTEASRKDGDQEPDKLPGQPAAVGFAEAVTWKFPPGGSHFDKPLLTFHLREPPALLTDLLPTLPALTCHLYFKKREGLSLLWYSQHEEAENLDDVRSTTLSTYLSELEFAYYDNEEDRWEIESQPKENQEGLYLLPDALKLTFTHQDETIVSAVYLPRRQQNAPLY